jgi:hypothetical protein
MSETDIESPAKPWQGKLYHSRGSSDDWGTIRDERHDAIIRVPITLDEKKLVEHRRAGTDPSQQIVNEILNRINAYEETKRQLDEAQNQLSQIYRWIERNQVDGFIDSLTYLQNLDRVTDDWYDRLDRLEVDACRFERERDKATAKLSQVSSLTESIVEKANALIGRWDQPSWKDTAPTAGYINALRNAVEAYEKTPK